MVAKTIGLEDEGRLAFEEGKPATDCPYTFINSPFWAAREGYGVKRQAVLSYVAKLEAAQSETAPQRPSDSEALRLLREARPYLRSHPVQGDALKVAGAIDIFLARADKDNAAEQVSEATNKRRLGEATAIPAPAAPSAPAEALTPETDAEQYHPFDNMGGDHFDWVVDADFARRLERQRDAALSRERQAAQSASGTHPNGLWVVWYEDASVKPEIFFGEGAEVTARARYAQAQINWSCHLLSRVSVASTSAGQGE